MGAKRRVSNSCRLLRKSKWEKFIVLSLVNKYMLIYSHHCFQVLNSKCPDPEIVNNALMEAARLVIKYLEDQECSHIVKIIGR